MPIYLIIYMVYNQKLGFEHFRSLKDSNSLVISITPLRVLLWLCLGFDEYENLNTKPTTPCKTYTKDITSNTIHI